MTCAPFISAAEWMCERPVWSGERDGVQKAERERCECQEIWVCVCVCVLLSSAHIITGHAIILLEAAVHARLHQKLTKLKVTGNFGNPYSVILFENPLKQDSWSQLCFAGGNFNTSNGCLLGVFGELWAGELTHLTALGGLVQGPHL